MNSDQVFEVLEQIAATGSRTEKEALLEPHIAKSTFRRILQYACDPMITFGLTPEKPASNREGLNFDHDSDFVWSVLDDLRYRRLTGNAAKEAVASLRSKLSSASDAIIWRILSKDLRAGMTANTVNRVAPGTIPVFKVMLAHPYEEKRVVQFPVGVEPKLDGLRVIGLVRGAECKFFSRTGKHFPALDHLAPDIIKMVTAAWTTAANAKQVPGVDLAVNRFYKTLGGEGGPSIALDAEVISGSFNKTTGDVRRKDEAAADAELNIFDAVPYHFMIGECQVFGDPFHERRQLVEFLVPHAPIWARVNSTLLRKAASLEEIQEHYSEFRSKGLEGAMVKPLDGLYAKTRSRAWMKMKACETEDLIITGAFEGSGKYEGSLGGLIVDRAGVEVRVGGGFTDAQRDEIWRQWRENPDSITGKMIEIEFHEATEDGSLRHPRFVGWRFDKEEKEAA